ncbi:hypothetical protein AGABI2DRAFT_176372 [Agaricus bisporus var. bisporus H97]|uniref:hypothetical protein n=1 Tax=Agaricus bisporus var. bisporus (strain H97 / ATCC MYA-4626 / FGSC 10389) TaxID=936046 RepID=UPI00029F7199|nr:hypothetical protein AGABI2DRAFT_176372 [Agaricus bisporus var. bisporus H97]EKV49721.1 hypothetical protein AGABI2DRAFT_176372 [Agaricus bisporus var. bisporus H97]
MSFLSKARRNAANDDVSRLLDPQYSPSRASKPIVKDTNGDFHDPDYRPFTPISPPPRSTSPRRHSLPRPYWETISMAEDDHADEDDDEDACDERRLSDGYAYSSMYAHRRSSGQYRRDNRYPYASPSSYTPAYSSFSCSPSSVVDYSPPNSYESRASSPLYEDDSENLNEKQGWAAVLRRRRKDKGRNKEMEDFDEDNQADVSPPPRETTLATISETVAKRDEYVPTCGDVFQRHWQTFCLAFNLSIFRAQRRLKHQIIALMATR